MQTYSFAFFLFSKFALLNYFQNGIVEVTNTGSVQTVSLPKTSYAKMECWGASGGDATYGSTIIKGGRGAYTRGSITLAEPLSLYIYVGEAGSYIPASPLGVDYNAKNGTFNGGGAAQNHSCVTATGGGATDIRLTNGNWDNFNSLKSRIMVAGAGGGGNTYRVYTGGNAGDGSGGHAGGLNGCNGTIAYATAGYTASAVAAKTPSTGGKQNAGGIPLAGSWVGDGGEQSCAPGSFGHGGSGTKGGYRQGGGAGYYGGGSGGAMSNLVFSGAGGSSFISGHTGCNAINSSSTENNISHSGSPNHYSGKVFTNTVMKAGNEVMPSPTGGTETGHSGNGYCIITWHPAL